MYTTLTCTGALQSHGTVHRRQSPPPGSTSPSAGCRTTIGSSSTVARAAAGSQSHRPRPAFAACPVRRDRSSCSFCVAFAQAHHHPGEGKKQWYTKIKPNPTQRINKRYLKGAFSRLSTFLLRCTTHHFGSKLFVSLCIRSVCVCSVDKCSV